MHICSEPIKLSFKVDHKKKAGNVIFLLLASDECVSVSHAGTHVSFLAVISSPCRQSVSLSLSPPLV